MGRVLAGMAAVLALLSLPLGAGAQGLHVGAYPPGAGPDAPRIGAYPAPLGTDPVSPPPGQVTSPSRQDETKDYCKSATPDCSVKKPDFHDLEQHKLDQETKTIQQGQELQHTLQGK